jgi:hypothetical protein
MVVDRLQMAEVEIAVGDAFDDTLANELSLDPIQFVCHPYS